MLNAIINQTLVFQDASVNVRKYCMLPYVPHVGTYLKARSSMHLVEAACFDIDNQWVEVALAHDGIGGVLTLSRLMYQFSNQEWMPMRVDRGRDRVSHSGVVAFGDQESLRYGDSTEGHSIRMYLQSFDQLVAKMQQPADS